MDTPPRRILAAVIAAAVLILPACRPRSEAPPPATQPSPATTTARAASDPLPTVVDYTLEPPVHADEVDSAGPKRVITLAPSATEMLAALGLLDRLVGRTQYDTHPPAVETVPVVGAMVDANLERILQLQPDLVVFTEGARKTLEPKLRSHVRLLVLPDNSVDDVYAAIRSFGQAMARPKTAARLVEALQRDIAALCASAKTRLPSPPQRVLLITGALPARPKPVWAAGPGSYLNDLLGRLGQKTVLADMNRPWVEVSLESLVRRNPQAIVQVRKPLPADQHQAVLDAWRGLDSVEALRTGRIATLGDPDLMLRPGPRVSLALRDLIAALEE